MPSFLERVQGHESVAALSDSELKVLADEVRQLVIACVSKTGGHLASNLGTVELTIALMAELDPEVDRIVWDVGHQCYAMKALTGRRDELGMLRCKGGPSGFPCMCESKADSFGTGHSSTSISAALGLAVARRLKGAKHAVVAVIGDGAMTGGMAYEAMNNAGALKEDLIVILNDNEQAISRNVGSISEVLGKIRFSPARRKLENGFKQMLSAIPWAGEKIRQAGHVVKRSLKGLLLPKLLFEDLGFTYMGPLDGHDIKLMRNAIKDAMKLGGPVLIHAVTKKGKGYAPAEKDPDSYHGTGPFDPATGIKAGNGPATFTDVFSEKVVELAERDLRIAAITAAMPSGTGLKAFAERFPGRYFDAGIAEQHAMTFAAGLAAGGMVPVIALYSTFLQRAFDQLVHDVALQNLHVVVCADRAGVVGEDGATHQGAYDLTMALAMPGVTVLAPSDGPELRGMLEWATGSATGPVLIRYPKDSAVPSLEAGWNYGGGGDGEGYRPGRARIIGGGADVAFICCGISSYKALDAKSILASEGIGASVLDVRSLRPLDEGLIREVVTAHKVAITVEEGAARGGLNTAVLMALEGGLSGRVRHVAFPEIPVRHGKRSEVLRDLGFDAEGLAEAARRALSERWD